MNIAIDAAGVALAIWFGMMIGFFIKGILATPADPPPASRRGFWLTVGAVVVYFAGVGVYVF